MAKSKNAGKYQSIEKVLYLSDQDKPLNVSINESKDTDLNQRVSILLKSGCLKKVGKDDCDNYYKITNKGKIKLLKLQIEVRKGLGKPTDMHEFELDELISQ